jgi:hypothetical protein
MFVVSKKKIKKKYFNKNVNSTCVRGVEIKVTLYNSSHCQGNSLSDRWSHLAAIWADLHVFDMSADRFRTNSKTIKADSYIDIYHKVGNGFQCLCACVWIAVAKQAVT